MPVDVYVYGLIAAFALDHSGHRCAGDWLTIALMKRATRLLAGMSYDVPPQDLRISRRKVPALPNSGFAITNVDGPLPSLLSAARGALADLGDVATSAGQRSSTRRFP